MKALRKLMVRWRDRTAIPPASQFRCGYTTAAEKFTSELQTAMEQDQTEIDLVYAERNKLVRALAELFPSGIRRTDIAGWSPEWHNCVYIDLPTGQVSWHYHDREAHLFADLPPYQGEWDGHTTKEKYESLAALRKSRKSPLLAPGSLICAVRFLEDMATGRVPTQGKYAANELAWKVVSEFERAVCPTAKPMTEEQVTNTCTCRPPVQNQSEEWHWLRHADGQVVPARWVKHLHYVIDGRIYLGGDLYSVGWRYAGVAQLP